MTATHADRLGWRLVLAVPATLIGLRVALGPLLVVAAFLHAPGSVCATMLVAGLASDILDGVIARAAACATPILRRADSAADVLFWLCTVAAAWTRSGGHLGADAGLLGIVIMSELLCQGVSATRFGRPPATHSYAAKLWGVLLFGAFLPLLGGLDAHVSLNLALAFGLVNAEVIGIMLLSPTQPIDVGSIWPLLAGTAHRRRELLDDLDRWLSEGSFVLAGA